MVLGVGDDDVAVTVDAEVLWAVERGLQGRAAVAGVAFLAGSGHRADSAGSIRHAQGVAATLQDVDVALGVGGCGPRIDEGRVGRRLVVLRYAPLAIAGDGMDHL